jgi:diacylglycerol kinase family enzyme
LVQRYFINIADVGFGAAIVHRWKDRPVRFGHNISYLLRTFEGLRHLTTYQNKRIKISAEGETEVISSCAVIVSNGPYLGKKIRIAPHARLDDGLLDLLIVGDVTKYELLTIWPALYSGSHVTHPKIIERKLTKVTIESTEEHLVEVDGDVVGNTPASFRIMPSALTIVV